MIKADLMLVPVATLNRKNRYTCVKFDPFSRNLRGRGTPFL